MRRREIRGAEKRNKGCGEEEILYFGATVVNKVQYCRAGHFVQGVSVQGVYVRGVLCPMGYLSRG